jgi:hypothetical protein
MAATREQSSGGSGRNRSSSRSPNNHKRIVFNRSFDQVPLSTSQSLQSCTIGRHVAGRIILFPLSVVGGIS